MLEVVAPVGTAPPLHVHHQEAEVFYLLEGATIYRAGDDAFELAPGSSINSRVAAAAATRWLIELPIAIRQAADEAGPLWLQTACPFIGIPQSAQNFGSVGGACPAACASGPEGTGARA